MLNDEEGAWEYCGECCLDDDEWLSCDKDDVETERGAKLPPGGSEEEMDDDDVEEGIIGGCPDVSMCCCCCWW